MADTNHCCKCGEQLLVEGRAVVHQVGERVFEGQVHAWRCSRCGERQDDEDGLRAFERAAAEWLAEHGVRTAQELKFMRKAAGLRVADLAHWLDVPAETIFCWETGKHSLDLVTQATIAAIVVETLRGESYTRDRLCAQKRPEGTRTVRLLREAA